MAIASRTKIGAMCAIKLIEKKSSKEPINFLGFEKTFNGLAKANGVQWCGNILRRDERLRKTLDFEVTGRGHGQSKMTWKRKEQIEWIRLQRKDATNRTKWHNGVYKLFKNIR